MIALKALRARQVLDSRGRPTVEVEAIADNGVVGRAIVPSGASTGRHEALELRDADSPRYGGLGVQRAVENVVREIGPALAGADLDDQAALDARLIALDGTPNKGRLGANAVLGASLAVAHAAARAHGEEPFLYWNRLWRERAGTLGAETGAGAEGPQLEPALPLPMVNMISGGLHAGGNLDIQDVLMVPIGAESYSAALEMAVALYRATGSVLKKRGFEADLVGDEGGYGPRLKGNEQAFEIVVEAMAACGLAPGRDAAIAVDIASTHFYDPERGKYRLGSEGGRELDSAAMIDLLEKWAGHYPIISIEDGLAEDDWSGWTALTARLGGHCQLIGDDLFATQVERLRLGAERGAGNAILIKVNQVGTLTETLDALALARSRGFRAVVSARSGETEDATIADLAVATAAGQIKIGSVARSERLAKYNRLLRIEEALENSATPGAGARFAAPFPGQRPMGGATR